MSRVVLDAGAFVAFEKGDVSVRARLAAARRLGLELATTSPVVAQVWRDGRRQVLLGRLVLATHVIPPGVSDARRAGELLARTRTSDVVDALLAGLVQDGDTLLTSDRDDLDALLSAAGTKATVLEV